jgi:hypothetical protein
VPGSPATSPVFGAPRYSLADAANFAADVNAVTDMFDSKAVMTTDSRSLTFGALTLNGSLNTTAGGVWTVATAGNGAFSNRLISTDTYPAFQVVGNGVIGWGPGGSTAVDTNLYRASANMLKTDDALTVAGNLFSCDIYAQASGQGTIALIPNSGANYIESGNAAFNASQDLVIAAAGGGDMANFSVNAGTAHFDGGVVVASNISISGSAAFVTRNMVGAGSATFVSKVAGDTYDRFIINAGGGLSWGPGGAGADVSLYRSGTQMLRVDQSLTVGGSVLASVVYAQTSSGTVVLISNAGANYIESGNGAWSASQDLVIAGYSGTTMSNFSVNATAAHFSGAIGVASNISITGSAALIARVQASTTSASFVNAVSGDSHDRFIITADGSLNWGSGAASTDVYLSRPGAGALAVGGSIQASAFNVVSDEVLKESVTSLDPARALDTVKAIEGVKHGWRGKETRRDFGFIAQQIQKVVPELVAVPDGDGPLSVDYMRLLPIAVEAIKHLAARVDVLEARG